jgi:hypothetical protein
VFSKKPKLIKLAQTSKGFEEQAEAFLVTQGFPVDGDGKKLFAAFVQHLPQDNDSFDPDLLGRMMRKARANELAFYMMHPDKAPKKEQENGKEGLSETSEEVV